jgi:hypothetical protein
VEGVGVGGGGADKSLEEARELQGLTSLRGSGTPALATTATAATTATTATAATQL